MKGIYMNIAAINNHYNISAKSQYDNGFQNDMSNAYATDLQTNDYQSDAIADYPAYMDDGMYGEDKKTSSNMLGLVSLGILAAAGLGYGIYKHKNSADVVKELKTKKEELADALKKVTEAEEKKTTAETALEAANQKIKELEDKLPKPKDKKSFWSYLNPKNWFNKTKKS